MMLIKMQNIQNRVKNNNFSIYICISLTLVGLIGFYASNVYAEPSEAITERPSFKYQEIKEMAKKLGTQNPSEELEKLAELSSDFIDKYPDYRRIDQIYYYLGNALIRIDRVQEGITIFEELIEKHPNARWGAPSLYELGLTYDKLGRHDEADKVFKKLIDHPKFGALSYATLAKKVLEKDIESRKAENAKPKPTQWVGKPAPDFQVKDLNGKALSLSKYKGQVVLLDFWATWCGPCLEELPNVKKTYQKYKDQKFQIIGISLDRSKPKLEAFVKKEELTWIHYWDKDQKLMKQYGVKGIPSMFLIDEDGIIRNSGLRGAALETSVAKLVKENLSKSPEVLVIKPKESEQKQTIPATKLIKIETTSPNGGTAQSFAKNVQSWIGKPAPDFQVKDLNGEELTLKEYRGQVVLLDFWATWCGPCISEMPKVKMAYEKFKDQKFQIIGVSLDRSKQPLDTYIKNEELAWVHYWDENREIRTKYGVTAIPTAFLIDGTGIIRKASLGGFDVETAVAELVKENLAKPKVKTPADSPTEGLLMDPKAKEVIDAAVIAHGGLEKLKSVKNIVTQSQSFEHFPDGEIQDEGTAKVYYFPNKFRSDWNDNNNTDTLIFDGETLFQLTNGVAVSIPEKNLETIIRVFKDSLFREPVWLLVKLAQNEISVQYLGTETIRGESASVLLITQPSGKDLKVYINDKTHYVIQFSYSFDLGKEGENLISSFDNYRDVEGIKFAHSRTTENGEYRQTLITDIKLNVEIDAALFRAPEIGE